MSLTDEIAKEFGARLSQRELEMARALAYSSGSVECPLNPNCRLANTSKCNLDRCGRSSRDPISAGAFSKPVGNS